MNTLKQVSSLALIFCLTVVSALAQAPAQIPAHASVRAGKPKTLAELQTSIAALLDQPKFAAARWGILIKAGQDKIVFERDAGKAFMPASNMKLYSTSAALDAFGPGFKIKTSVYATKPAKAGMLRGDLILYGRGDPNLSARFDKDDPARYNDHVPADSITPIESLADQIKASGVRIVTGNLIGDDSFFAGDLLGPSWEWDDLEFYYGAEVSALTVNDNCVSFTITPAKKLGEKPAIAMQPHTAYVKIINNAKTVESGPVRIRFNRPLDSNIVEFYGSIPQTTAKHQVNVAIHDPARYAATLLKEALARRKIRVLGKVGRLDAQARVAKPFDESKLTEVASIDSQPMSELIKVVNKESQNLHAELMLRLLGASDGRYELDDFGRPKSSISLGNEARRQFLQKAGVEVASLSLRDGSGLARQDLVTPRSTVRLLEFMLAHPHVTAFRESLPIAGIDGTLERRMRDSVAASNLRGKTGTLSYVNALSGYVTTKRGQIVIFSMMGNNYVGPGRDVTGVFDQIGVLLAEYDGEL